MSNDNTVILELKEKTKYEVTQGKMEQKEMDFITREVKKLKGYPWEIKDQPKKIIYIPGKLINFVT